MKHLFFLTSMISAIASSMAYSQNLLPEKVSYNLTQFKSKGDAESLLNAIKFLKVPKESNLIEMTKLQLTLLGSISASFDSNYDSNPPPPIQVHVMPPLGYDSGVSPNEIKDPVQKKDYEKRIEDNNKNVQQHQIQRAIRDVVLDIANSISQLDPTIQKEVESSSLVQSLPKAIKKLVLSTTEAKRMANKAQQDNR